MKKYSVLIVLLGIIIQLNAKSTLLPMKAIDISVGADGTVWTLGNTPVPGGANVWRRAPGAAIAANFTKITGSAGMKIAGSPDGDCWIVNDKNQINQYTKGKWQNVSGSASDIGVGGDGSVWIVGTNKVSGGFGISRWNADRKTWQSVTGGAVRITVDFNGVAWIVDDQGRTYSWSNNRWNQFGGSTVKGVDVGSGVGHYLVSNKSVSGGTQVYQAKNNAWNVLNDSGKPVGAVAVADDKKGVIYITTDKREVYAITN